MARRRQWIGPVVMETKDSDDFVVPEFMFEPALCVETVEQLWNLPPLVEGKKRRVWLKVSKKPLSKHARLAEFYPTMGLIAIDNQIHFLYEWMEEQGKAILGNDICDCYVELWYEDVRCR